MVKWIFGLNVRPKLRYRCRDNMALFRPKVASCNYMYFNKLQHDYGVQIRKYGLSCIENMKKGMDWFDSGNGPEWENQFF
jgi:hypothetical protein